VVCGDGEHGAESEGVKVEFSRREKGDCGAKDYQSKRGSLLEGFELRGLGRGRRLGSRVIRVSGRTRHALEFEPWVWQVKELIAVYIMDMKDKFISYK